MWRHTRHAAQRTDTQAGTTATSSRPRAETEQQASALCPTTVVRVRKGVRPGASVGVVRHAVRTPAHSDCLEAVELRAVPVAALRVVADGVARAQTDPVGERAVGLAQVAHEALHTESLVGAHCQK